MVPAKMIDKHCRPRLALLKKSAAEACLRRPVEVFSFVQDGVLRSSVVQTCRCGLPIGQHTRQTRPPTGLRGWRNQPSSAVPVEPDAMRVACPCSTEARRRNPDSWFWLCFPGPSIRVIPTFYPIALLREWGRCGKTSTAWSRPSCAEVGERPSQEAANPPTGLGPA